MKKILYILILITLLGAWLCVARTKQPLPIKVYTQDEKPLKSAYIGSEWNRAERAKQPYKYLGEYTIFAYCPCVKCCGKDNGITASGVVAVEGVTVACELPFDTELTIEGIGERVVQDRGGAIYGKRIDMFMESHVEAEKFGVRRVKVWVKQ